MSSISDSCLPSANDSLMGTVIRNILIFIFQVVPGRHWHPDIVCLSDLLFRTLKCHKDSSRGMCQELPHSLLSSPVLPL